jgi:hypothetical protein
MAYLLNVDLGQIVVFANSISELDVKVREAGFLHYEIERVVDYVIL